MQVEASASTATTPNPQYTDPTWLTDGGTRGRTDDNRLANLGIGLHSSAGFYSGSGDIDSVVPVSGQFENTDFGGLRRGPNPDNSDVPTDVPPIPAPTTGVGHSLGVSSSSSSNSQTSMDHRIGMRARLDRDGKLKSLEGQMRNEAQDKLNQQGRDNNALTLRHEEGDALNGFRSVITTGRNANGNVVIDAANKFQAELELGQDQQATFLPDEVKTELDVGGSTGKVNFEFVSTSGWGEASSRSTSRRCLSRVHPKHL